jgi:diguanylate cyclase (GGDEF)-like protein
MMGSFRVKLVLWFALLALLPLAVAFYGYDTLAKRSEARRVDVGLEAAVRGAVSGYAARLDAASVRSGELASDPQLQRALRGHDLQTIRRVVASTPNTRVRSGGVVIGSIRAPAAASTVIVKDRSGRVLGEVSVGVPIDSQLLHVLSTGLLAPGDRLVAAQSGRIFAGVGRGLALQLDAGRTSRVRVGRTEYRGLSTGSLTQPHGVSFVALAPQSQIDAAARSSERGILMALIGSLALFAIVIYLLGRSIVGTLCRLAEAANALARGQLGERVEVGGRDEFAQLGSAFNDMAAQLEQRLAELETERTRVRDATTRFGEALVATHDPTQLLRVVVESAVEATGASGGLVFGPQGELVRAGDPEAPGERIAFPLRAGQSDFGQLVITSPSFDADQVETAASLAAQAVVALDNARLHRIVERQALVDSLTGLANRRNLEDTLRSELARAARFNDVVCVVLADLDDFKQINDRYGHPVGDEVLKEFAQTLRKTVRETDVAARWGGEEFALVLPGTDAAGGARLAERARAMLSEQTVRAPDGTELHVTASFGVAAFPQARELDELLAAADLALYAAKHDGKNRVVASAETFAR